MKVKFDQCHCVICHHSWMHVVFVQEGCVEPIKTREVPALSLVVRGAYTLNEVP